MQHVLEYVSDGEKPHVATQPRAPYLFEQRRTEEAFPDYFIDADYDEPVYAEPDHDGPNEVDHADEVDKEPVFSSESSAIEIGAPVSPDPLLDKTASAPLAESRRLRNLFTLLRRKQQGRL
ncbi:MAG: hypothetical protein B7Z55_11475 [Planctomycetales bacterium 12-60-4]|nr:MAG: hypothetical protein B7Z55_11475 [Planctomycetales bacterium 12-60-4]